MDNTRTPDMVETTDCLEAVGVFRTMKNLFFFTTMAAMVVLLAIFILEAAGRVDDSPCAVDAAGNPVITPCEDCLALSISEKAFVAAQSQDIKKAAEVVSQTASAPVPNTNPAPQPVMTAPADANTPAASDIKAIQGVFVKKLDAFFSRTFSCWHLSLAVQACNFILLPVAVLYCLTLLMTLKISLYGRLGGINHIGRAFFLSLFALVLLLPWQVIFKGIVVGGMFLPTELFCDWGQVEQLSNVFKTLYFLRFGGMWLVIALLLMMAQLRSIRWGRVTLRRLGLVR